MKERNDFPIKLVNLIKASIKNTFIKIKIIYIYISFYYIFYIDIIYIIHGT